MEAYYNLISRQVKVDIPLTDMTRKTQIHLLEGLLVNLGISQKLKPETIDDLRNVVESLPMTAGQDSF